MTDQDKKVVYKNQLQEKHLQFADCIEDEQMEQAKKLFYDPFFREKQEDSYISISDCIVGMEEIAILKELVSEPISENPEINQKVQQYINDPNLDVMGKTNKKFQIYMLTALNQDGMNVLHISCERGSDIIEFLIREADILGIRHHMINIRESQGRSALFFLCKVNFNKKRHRSVEFDDSEEEAFQVEEDEEEMVKRRMKLLETLILGADEHNRLIGNYK